MGSAKEAILNYRLTKSLLVVLFLSLVGSSVARALTTIDDAWLKANGPAPYYLDKAGEIYRLETDVNTPGTAFAIINSGITFDLNGHKITFGDSAPIEVPNGDFEDSGVWGSAPITPGTFVKPVSVFSGNRSLKFVTPTGNQSYVASTPVTLLANTTYTLSAMFCNKYEDMTAGGSIRLFVRFDEDPTISVETVGYTWRPFQYLSKVFYTGNASKQVHLVAGIDGATGAKGAVYIDDIRIQRQYDHGIVTGIPGWQSKSVPGVKRYGAAHNTTIFGGDIRQGKGGSCESHGIYQGALNDNLVIHDMRIHVNGANSRNILIHENCDNIRIENNVLTSDVRAISNRDMIEGIMVEIVQGATGIEVRNNTFTGGPQGGVKMGNAKDRPLIIGNTFALRGLYTNGFAVYGGNADVRNNFINCHVGEYGCRGIAVGDGSVIDGNTINVRYLPTIQEYNGCSLGGAYGIQAEGPVNAIIRNNIVNAYADECDAVAYRTNEPWQGIDKKPWHDNYVYNNQFNAIQRGTAVAYPFKASSLYAGVNHQFHDNILTTNSRWFLLYDSIDQDLVSNTFVRTGDASGSSKPFIIDGTKSPNFRFIDNRFVSVDEKTKFFSATWKFTVAWIVSVVVKNGAAPLANSLVEIFDKNNNRIFSKTTDGSGVITTTVNEFTRDGLARTYFGPHRLQVTSTLGVRSLNVTIDASKTIVVNYGDDQPPDVDAGGDQTVRLSEQAILHGTYVDESIAKTIEWRKVSGPGGVSFSNPASSDGAAQFSQVGQYELALKVTDLNNNGTEDVVKIFVIEDNSTNAPPRVNAGNDFSGQALQAITLSGVVSDDGVPGEPHDLETIWEKVSGPGTVQFVDDTSPATDVVFPYGGTYKLRLTAFDGELGSSDELVVTVRGRSADAPGGSNLDLEELKRFVNVVKSGHPEVSIPCNSNVKIYTQRGTHVTDIVCSNNVASWNARGLASGVYMILEPNVDTRKIVIVK